MRDDRLGGTAQLTPVFEFLRENGQVDTALKEKREAVEIWRNIERLANEIAFPDPKIAAWVRTSRAYGALVPNHSTQMDGAFERRFANCARPCNGVALISRPAKRADLPVALPWKLLFDVGTRSAALIGRGSSSNGAQKPLIIKTNKLSR